mmetsp:Transcript_39400/g.125263  ORF Transcript_39400/g.125263 Transcript_39400/m.125263 type:complete len:205 (-) Transcript_39400:1211-1825(-)
MSSSWFAAQWSQPSARYSLMASWRSFLASALAETRRAMRLRSVCSAAPGRPRHTSRRAEVRASRSRSSSLTASGPGTHLQSASEAAASASPASCGAPSSEARSASAAVLRSRAVRSAVRCSSIFFTSFFTSGFSASCCIPKCCAMASRSSVATSASAADTTLPARSSAVRAPSPSAGRAAYSRRSSSSGRWSLCSDSSWSARRP